MFATNVEECLEFIKEEIDSNKIYIEYLHEENRKLKDEHYKDKKVQEMQAVTVFGVVFLATCALWKFMA